MNRLLIALLLTAFNTSAMATWIKVGSNDTLNFDYYVDTATSKDGNKVKMWDIKDFKTARTAADGQKYRSAKLQREYDCKEAKDRLLNFSMHSGNMGEGKVIWSLSGHGKWEQSVSVAYLKIACTMQ